MFSSGWKRDKLSPPVLVFPQETGAGDAWAQRHQPHFSLQMLRYSTLKEWIEWMNQRFQVGVLRGRLLQHHIFHLRCDALHGCLTPMLSAITGQADWLLCNMENKGFVFPSAIGPCLAIYSALSRKSCTSQLVTYKRVSAWGALNHQRLHPTKMVARCPQVYTVQKACIPSLCQQNHSWRIQAPAFQNGNYEKHIETIVSFSRQSVEMVLI